MIRDRSLLALVSAELISRLGSQLSNLALPWFVLVTTGSATRMGFVFALELVPFVLFGVPAGAVVDRLGPRATMLVSDLARAPVVALVPFLHEVGGLSYGIVLAVAFLHGLFSTAYFTCQRVAIPSIVGDDEQRIARANALVEGATNFTNFAGPGLAGVLISLIGAATVMWIDAVSYVVAFVLIGGFVRVVRQAHGAGESGGLWAGLGYLRHDGLVARAATSSLIYGFLFPIVVASFPVIAYRQYHHDARIAGWLLMAFGGGQVAGSLATYVVLSRVPQTALAAAAAVGLSAPLWLLVPHTPLAGVIAALALSGFCNPMINAPYIAILSTRIPKALLAKVFQAIITANQVAGPAGYALAGALFAGLGLHATYAIVAALATLAAANFVQAVLTSEIAVAPQAA
jgi:predicted MFS family arabinose efflux permease